MADLYYVSQPAYNGLILLAENAGFLSFFAKNKVGISEFLVRMSFSDYIDSRSDILREKHEKWLKLGRMPKWWIEGEIRTARMLTLTEEAIINYIETAIRLGVRPANPPVMGIRNYNNPHSIVSLMLEAIGNGYLTPVVVPKAVFREDNKRPVKTTQTIPKKRIQPITEDSPYYLFLRRGKKNATA